MNKICNNTIYHPQYKYHVGALITILALAAIGTTLFAGLHRWQGELCSQRISHFFSTHLALRALIVSTAVLSLLLFPFVISSILAYKSARLKSKLLPDEAEALLKKIVKHNGSLFTPTINEPLTDELLEQISQMLINDESCDPRSVIEKLSMLTLNLSQDNARKITPKQAEQYLELTKKKQHFPLTLYLSSAINEVITLIGNIIETIGIADLFKNSESGGMEASLKAQKIFMLVSILTILVQLLIPSVGAKKTGIIIGNSLGGLTLLSILWPYITPIPKKLPCDARNLTREALAGQIHSSSTRQTTCNEIAAALAGDGDACRGVILIGPPRIGKTTIAENFIAQVTEGKYPGLAGKFGIYLNTGDAVSYKPSNLKEGTTNPFTTLAHALGKHRRNSVLLICDEIHTALLDIKNPLANQMKSAFDSTNGIFKYVIGMTTYDEYYRYIAGNPAFADRFTPIFVKAMKIEETVGVLNEALLKESTLSLTEENILSYIVTKSSEIENASQPHKARQLLNKCITRLHQNSAIERTRQEITALESQFSSDAEENGIQQQLTAKQEQLIELEKQQKERKRIERIVKQLRREKYKVVVKLAAMKEEHKDRRKIESRLTLLKKFETSLIKKMEATVAQCDYVRINRDLVDEMFAVLQQEEEIKKSKRRPQDENKED